MFFQDTRHGLAVFTIVPVGDLKTLSASERAKYVLQQLPRFKQLGWMTADALHWYQQNLNRIDLATVSHRAEQDLGQGISQMKSTV